MHYPQYDIIQHYPASETIAFTTTKAPWGLLSNFARTPMQANGISFACVEQMFHYIRLNNQAERDQYLKVAPGMALKMKAKSFARRGVERDDWRQMAVDAMRFCLNCKYLQSEAFRQELERTRGMHIVEDESNRRRTPDSWGAVLDPATGHYHGKNIMGRLLMELRDNPPLPHAPFTF